MGEVYKQLKDVQQIDRYWALQIYVRALPRLYVLQRILAQHVEDPTFCHAIVEMMCKSSNFLRFALMFLGD